MNEIFESKIILTPHSGADKNRALFEACKISFERNLPVEITFNGTLYSIDPWQVVEDVEEGGEILDPE